MAGLGSLKSDAGVADAVGGLGVGGDDAGGDFGLIGVGGEHGGDAGDGSLDDEGGVLGVGAEGRREVLVELVDDEAVRGRG